MHIEKCANGPLFCVVLCTMFLEIAILHFRCATETPASLSLLHILFG